MRPVNWILIMFLIALGALTIMLMIVVWISKSIQSIIEKIMDWIGEVGDVACKISDRIESKL
jgi:hypothetical protein